MTGQLALLDAGPAVDLLDVDTCQRRWQVEPGEVFLLAGQTAGHVLMCGDSRSPEVARRMIELSGFARRRVAIADPPYGLGLRFGENTTGQGGHTMPARRTDRMIDGGDRFDASWMPVWRAAASPCAVYLFTGWTVSAAWHEAMKANGWAPKHRIIWDKLHYGSGDITSYGDQTEDVFVWFGRGVKPIWPKREGNVWHEPRGVALEGGQVGHPTPKPFGLYRRPIEHVTAPGDVVLDMFAGSGPALIVADGLRRRAALVDASPRYCALILERASRYSIHLTDRFKDPACSPASPACSPA